MFKSIAETQRRKLGIDATGRPPDRRVVFEGETSEESDGEIDSENVPEVDNLSLSDVSYLSTGVGREQQGSVEPGTSGVADERSQEEDMRKRTMTPSRNGGGETRRRGGALAPARDDSEDYEEDDYYALDFDDAAVQKKVAEAQARAEAEQRVEAENRRRKELLRIKQELGRELQTIREQGRQSEDSLREGWHLVSTGKEYYCEHREAGCCGNTTSTELPVKLTTKEYVHLEAVRKLEEQKRRLARARDEAAAAAAKASGASEPKTLTAEPRSEAQGGGELAEGNDASSMAAAYDTILQGLYGWTSYLIGGTATQDSVGEDPGENIQGGGGQEQELYDRIAKLEGQLRILVKSYQQLSDATTSLTNNVTQSQVLLPGSVILQGSALGQEVPAAGEGSRTQVAPGNTGGGGNSPGPRPIPAGAPPPPPPPPPGAPPNLNKPLGIKPKQKAQQEVKTVTDETRKRDLRSILANSDVEAHLRSKVADNWLRIFKEYLPKLDHMIEFYPFLVHSFSMEPAKAFHRMQVWEDNLFQLIPEHRRKEFRKKLAFEIQKHGTPEYVAEKVTNSLSLSLSPFQDMHS